MLPRSRCVTHSARRPRWRYVSLDRHGFVPVELGRERALATARSAVQIAKRMVPFTNLSCSSVNASPGRTALWNFTFDFNRRGAPRLHACPSACRTASSNTTPGNTGIPGKWPVYAGWSAEIVRVVRYGAGNSTSTLPGRRFNGRRQNAEPHAEACRFRCAVAIRKQQRSRKKHRVDPVAQLSVTAAAFNPGATTTARHTRHAAAEFSASSRTKKAPSVTPGMALS